MQPVRKATTTLSTGKRDPDSLRSSLRRQRPQLIWSIILFTLANGGGMASSIMLMRLVDQALAGSFSAVSQTLIIIAIIYVLIIPIDILHIKVSSQYLKSSMLTIRQNF